jgi:hypothetical protein
VVPFEEGHRPLGVAIAENVDDEIVLTMEELDIEGLVAVDIAAAVDELLRDEDDAIAEDELVEVREATMEEAELLLGEELEAGLDELESDTAPATLSAAFVAPLYTNTPDVDFG